MSSSLPSRISSKPAIVSLRLTSLPCEAGELRGDEERLREELLDLAGARDDELVVLAELVHAEDGDDVLQILVLLQRLLDAARDAVVPLADDLRDRAWCEVESSGSTAG